MATSLVVTIKSSEADPSRFAQSSTADQEGMRGIVRLLEACQGGYSHAAVDVQYSTSAPVAASATVTCASVAADDTVTLGGVTLTAKASPAGEAQWDQSGNDTADGAALAACINAHSTLSKQFSASAAAGVVTITCLVKGVVGNACSLVTSNGTRLAATGSGWLAGGTGGATSAAVTYSMGL